MSEGALKKVFAVLGGLLVVYGIVALLGRGGDAGPADGDTALAAALAALSADAVDAVELRRGGEEVVRLERGGRTGWTVNGQPADSGHAARLLTALDEATVGDVVSRNPSNHARMEVDDASATELVVVSGGTPDTLLVGKAGPGYGSVYVRLPGEDAVQVVEADLRSAATRTVDTWRSKRLAVVDTAALRSVELSTPDDSFRLDRDGEGWSVDGAPADSTTVAALLGELGSLEGTGLADGGVPDRDPDHVLTLRSDAGVELTLRLWEPGEDGGSNLTAVAEGPASIQPGVPLAFPSWRAGRLTPDRDEVVAGTEEGGP